MGINKATFTYHRGRSNYAYFVPTLRQVKVIAQLSDQAFPPSTSCNSPKNKLWQVSFHTLFATCCLLILTDPFAGACVTPRIVTFASGVSSPVYSPETYTFTVPLP